MLAVLLVLGPIVIIINICIIIYYILLLKTLSLLTVYNLDSAKCFLMLYIVLMVHAIL